jgi:hypothetical protein
MEQWKERVVHKLKNSHGNSLVNALFARIEKDRLGQLDQDSSSIKKSILSLGRRTNLLVGYLSTADINQYSTYHPLSVYEEEFEAPFIKLTQTFFHQESCELSRTLDISSFMARVRKNHDDACRSTWDIGVFTSG